MNTMGVELKNGRKLDLQVEPNNWQGIRQLAEDSLYVLHGKLGGTDQDMPCDEILVTVILVRRLADTVMAYDRKIDQMIDENSALADELASLKEGLQGIIENLEKK